MSACADFFMCHIVRFWPHDYFSGPNDGSKKQYTPNRLLAVKPLKAPCAAGFQAAKTVIAGPQTITVCSTMLRDAYVETAAFTLVSKYVPDSCNCACQPGLITMVVVGSSIKAGPTT